MELLKAVQIRCPYCGEAVEVVVDCTLPRHEYIEDCEVCCRPMIISVSAAEGDSPQVDARQEDE